MGIFMDGGYLREGWIVTFVIGGIAALAFVIITVLVIATDRMGFDFEISRRAEMELALRSANPIVLDHATGQALKWNKDLASKKVCNTKWYCDLYATDKWDLVLPIEL